MNIAITTSIRALNFSPGLITICSVLELLWTSNHCTLMSAINNDVRERAVLLVGAVRETQIFEKFGHAKWSYMHEIIKEKHFKNAQDGLQCRFCGETGAYITMKQTRSADEGMTAIATCPTCGKSWVP